MGYENDAGIEDVRIHHEQDISNMFHHFLFFGNQGDRADTIHHLDKFD